MITCPYCGFVTEDAGDCETPGVVYNEDCQKCGMFFALTVEYTPVYTAVKAPCMNGHPHKWRDSYPPITERCEWCGGTREKEKVKP